MSLNYGIGLDTSQMERDVQKANQLFKNVGDNAQAQANRIDMQFRNAFAFAGGTAAVTAFISQLVNVRGEFQQLEIAFTTMLKSKEKSDKLMQNITEFAATTPFDLKQVAAGTKQLLAYGFAADDITQNLSMIGNVASGVGSQIGDLIYLYGTLKASGRVTQMDINQFAGRGIPIYEELAKVLGVNRDQVRSFVSEGKVGFEQVEKAFQGMTGEGGIFYNLMQEQSKSITGQLSNLGDAVDKMFNQIGQSSEGIISGAIGVAQDLVANYETVGKVIGVLVATYGAYKAAIMVLSVVQKANTLIQLESALAGRTLTAAQGLQAIATKGLTAATSMLNKTMLANPYVLAATAIVAVVAAMWALSDSTTAADKAQKEYNREKESASELESKHKEEIEKLISTATNQALADMERVSALQNLKLKYPEIFREYDIETLKLADILKIKKQIAEADNKEKQKNNVDTLTNIDSQIKEYQNKIQIQRNSGGQQSAGLVASYLREIQKLEAKKQLYTQDVEADNVNNFLSSVTGISNEKLDSEIKIRQQLLIKIGKSNSVGKLDGLGAFTKDELSSQLDSLVAEQKKRKEVTTTGNDDIRKSNSKLRELQQERNRIITSKLTPADREKQLKDVDEQIEAVNKKIKLLGGNSAKDNTKDNNQAKKLAQEKADIELKQTNDTIKSGFEQKQAELDIQKAKTSAMKDGFAKQKHIVEDEHQQNLLDIDKRTQELVEKQQDAERVEWQKNGSKGVFKPKTTNSTQLSEDNSRLISSLTQTVEIKYKSDTGNLLKSLSDSYSSFDEKRRDVDEKYKSDKTLLETEFSGDVLISKLNELKLQHKEAIQQINSEEVDFLYKTSDSIVGVFSETSTKSVSELKKIANEASSLFSYLSNTNANDLTDKEIGGKKYTKSQLTSMKSDKGFMSDLKNRTKEVSDIALNADVVFGGFGVSIKNVFDAFKSGDKSVDGTKKKIDSVSNAFSTMQSFAGQATSVLNAMSKEEGDAASSAAKSIGAVMDVAGSTLQGFQQGGIIGGAVALVSSVATKIFEAEKAHQQALKEIQENKISQQKEYNDLLIEQNKLLKDADTVFGKNSFGQAKGYVQQYLSYLQQAQKSIDNLSSAKVVTGSKKTGLFGWGGEKDVYSSLLKIYPDLINSEGMLNQELAESILNNSKLDDASKKALQSALDYSQKYEEALESLKGYLSGVFGSLGNDLMTSITDNIGDSKSALKDFADYTSSTLEQMASDIAYSLYFADLFNSLSSQVEDAMKNTNLTDEEKAARQVELMGNFFNSLGGQTEAANEFLKNFQSQAEQYGLDLFGDDSRTSSSKGIATASQESVDENNGRLTVIQGHTFMINENTASIKSDMALLRENSSAVLRHLAGIETNTSRLEAVENAVVSIKSGIDTINLKGVRLQ